MNVIEILAKGLQEHSRQQAAFSLGDRSRYVGMSDIGRGVDCLRSAVAGKLNHSAAPVSLDRSLRLQRGHWFEAGIAEAFHFAGNPYLYQLGIQTTYQGVPVRAHPDFVFITPKGDVHIVELKSCEHIPDTAYAAHEMQIFGQLGFLAFGWPYPRFSLYDGGECFSFPHLVQNELNLTLPPLEQTSITGTILYVSMNEAKPFGPYAPNGIMLDACLNLAKTIWEGTKHVQNGMSLNDLDTAVGWHPLCDYCDWNADCSRFSGINAADMEPDLSLLTELKAERERLAERIKEEEKRLKASFQNLSPQGDWINAVTQRFRVGTSEGRKTLDKERLLSALTAHLPAEIAESVLSAGYKTGQPSERLFINTIN
jgi:hypothetical protein